MNPRTPLPPRRERPRTIVTPVDQLVDDCTDVTGTTDMALRQLADHQAHFRAEHIDSQPLQRVERHIGDDTPKYSYEDTAAIREKHPEDATKAVHHSHYALLYLMSNPEEFKSCLSKEYSSIKDWQEEGDEVDAKELRFPYVVFASDAEVVLPQAHTASQLFGVETVEGVELEAAAGVPALSQLFLRWLALTPGGDHMNMVDPPGLTVMRIAGGRYRVTAAHRVVWTWLNDFLPETIPSFASSTDSPRTKEELRFTHGDLVTMTIVDVFETDKEGKLLSYCPTFDNRSVTKTYQTKERIFKESMKVKNGINYVAQSQAANKVNKVSLWQMIS